GVTAVPLETRPADALEALESLLPEGEEVVALIPPNDLLIGEATAAAKRTHFRVRFKPLKTLDNFQEGFRNLLNGTDAVWILPDARLASPELVRFMVTVCLERKIPLVGFLDGMTRIGALASVAPDFASIGRE